MLLSPEDVRLFFKLQCSLMVFVNQRLNLLPDVACAADFFAETPEARLKVRNALLENLGLIDSFVDENPARLSDDELAIVSSWRHCLTGRFYLFRQLKNYMVFLSASGPPVAYGVVAISEPFENVIGPDLPKLSDAVLLPFKDRIIYDGLLTGYNISFGGGIKRSLNDSYRQAKERLGVVTSLPRQSMTSPADMTSTTPSKASANPSSKTVRRKTKTANKKVSGGEELQQMMQDVVGKVIGRDSIGRRRGKKSSSAGPIFQFKITLMGSKPAIWRRIQVDDCTLDKFHEHIQAAMGWTNSHLNQFEIDGTTYGNLTLLNDGFMEFECVDSTATNLSDVVPRDAKRFRLLYEYDFGDGWEHEVLLEGRPPAERGQKHPLCVEGQRACPPEDVGGVWGYAEFLQALADPNHEQHDDFLEWSGSFDPNQFDAAQATRLMRQGLPSLR